MEHRCLLTNGSPCGSGSCYFDHWLSRRQQKTNWKNFWRYIYIIFQDKKSNRNQGFSYYFCLMTEGSGSGSIPLTNGSGSRTPKNMWIRWIRIRNTAVLSVVGGRQLFVYMSDPRRRWSRGTWCRCVRWGTPPPARARTPPGCTSTRTGGRTGRSTPGP